MGLAFFPSEQYCSGKKRFRCGGPLWSEAAQADYQFAVADELRYSSGCCHHPQLRLTIISNVKQGSTKGPVTCLQIQMEDLKELKRKTLWKFNRLGSIVGHLSKWGAGRAPSAVCSSISIRLFLEIIRFRYAFAWAAFRSDLFSSCSGTDTRLWKRLAVGKSQAKVHLRLSVAFTLPCRL